MKLLRAGGLARVAAVVLVGAACSTHESATPGPVGNCMTTDRSLADLAAAHGKVYGTAFSSTYTANDPCYLDVAASEFNSLTTEIGTMTNTVQPKPGVFDFSEADAVADVAAAHHQDFQIHALIWDPLDQAQWGIVPQAIKQLAPEQRHRLMIDSVSAIMRHFAGRSSTATVVNEAFDQMGRLQPNTWWETTRSDRYIFDAFRAARLADPTALLFYNDHSAETHSDKSNAIYDLAKRLRDTTVDVVIDGGHEAKPLIDGIGFQAHMLGGKDQQPSVTDMASNLQRFADLGLTIRFTELDVRIPVVNGRADPADLDRQRAGLRHDDQPLCATTQMLGHHAVGIHRQALLDHRLLKPAIGSPASPARTRVCCNGSRKGRL